MALRAILTAFVCIGLPSVAYAGYATYEECMDKNSAQLSANVISYVQQHLKDDGFKIKRVDGMLGSGTKSAIKAYRAKYGLPGSEAIDVSLLEKMAGPGSPVAEQVKEIENWCLTIFGLKPEPGPAMQE
jgi:peptidoglycan hydrolase-like protein with peptidoglycan-binding domain